MTKISVEIFKDGFNPKAIWRAKITMEGISTLSEGFKTKKSLLGLMDILLTPDKYEAVVWRNFELDK